MRFLIFTILMLSFSVPVQADTTVEQRRALELISARINMALADTPYDAEDAADAEKDDTVSIRR